MRAGPVLFVILSLAIFSVSALNPASMQTVRTKTTDVFAPLLATVNKPFYHAAEYARAVTGLASLQAENLRLQQENIRLKQWYQTALSLQAENQSLQNLLNLKTVPHHRYVTARVIADSGNAFAKSLLVLAGSDDGVAEGQAALGREGLIGRVIENGRSTARILLLHDINSRIPVLIQGVNQRAVMAGNNDNLPLLMHLPPDAVIEQGARVITSGHGGLFPYGLPVGEIIKTDAGLLPSSHLLRLTVLIWCALSIVRP